MADKSKMNSPFTNPHGVTAPPLPVNGDLTGRNMCPYFDHKHDMGPNTIPVVFEAGLHGRRYHGQVHDKAALSSPMRSSR